MNFRLKIQLACVILVVPFSFTQLRSEDNRQTIEFTSPYSKFTWAGGGNVVALHFPERDDVLAYDVSSGEILYAIDDVGESDLLVGGKNKLVVVTPEKMLIRRYDLKTGKRDKLVVLEGEDRPQLALMGYNGNGPLLLLSASRSQLIDLETLKPISVEGKLIDGFRHGDVSVHVSSEGRTFGYIPVGFGPVSYTAVHLFNGKETRRVECGDTSNAIRWMQPTANGNLLLRPGGVIFDGNGREISLKEFEDGALIPSTDPGLFLDVRLDARDKFDHPAANITVCSTANCNRLVNEIGFHEIVPERITSWHSIANALRLGHQWRVHLLASKNRLATLPVGNKRLFIRDFNLQKKLREAGSGFLYVSSTPPLRTSIGEKMEYRVRAKSSDKIDVMKLESGPNEAQLENGRLIWEPPADYAKPFARFLISIKSSDREFLHSFEVAVDRNK